MATCLQHEIDHLNGVLFQRTETSRCRGLRRFPPRQRPSTKHPC
ncbi:MAG: peptide deformylase, partial [Mesorhizobium sp.]